MSYIITKESDYYDLLINTILGISYFKKIN